MDPPGVDPGWGSLRDFFDFVVIGLKIHDGREILDPNCWKI